jgi:hypothetical protein
MHWMKKFLYFSLIAVIISVLGKFLFEKYEAWYIEQLEGKGGLDYAVINYKKSVDSLAGIFKLPPDYLMAVIMLESSGRKKVPVRYEKGIYEQLKLLQDGKIEKFENLSKSDLKGVKDKTIRALASSYGPFQIMGYKKYILNINLDDLTGKNNMYYAIKWIDLSYGEMLRNNEFKDAFHFHNAGKRYPLDGTPLTHDPKYVENGLFYQKYFKEIIYHKK